VCVLALAVLHLSCSFLLTLIAGTIRGHHISISNVPSKVRCHLPSIAFASVDLEKKKNLRSPLAVVIRDPAAGVGPFLDSCSLPSCEAVTYQACAGRWHDDHSQHLAPHSVAIRPRTPRLQRLPDPYRGGDGCEAGGAPHAPLPSELTAREAV
jgi:hypothetical protein